MNYKMQVYPAIEAGNPWTRFMFETAEQMIVARDTVASLLIFLQDQAKVMDDYSNIVTVEEKVNGEWIEYEEFRTNEQ